VSTPFALLTYNVCLNTMPEPSIHPSGVFRYMSRFNDIAALDATGQAELVAHGDVQPVDLVNIAIERLERVNPTINAVVTPMYDIALKAASAPIPTGPFTGVPFLLKEFLAEYAGVRFTEGSEFLGEFIPDLDSELVARYKAAGLIVFGKTNTPEFAIGVTTEPSRFGPTRNPWDTSRTPGGSSGGSAAAVAAGVVPMAHGNDAGGSIRIPASCCGVFGLRPTRGRNPLGPHYGDLMSGMVSEHALTMSVRDSAALLDATSGPALGDPYAAPPRLRPFAKEVGADPGRLRIAFSDTTPLGTELDPECVQAVRDAAALCADLGHEVVQSSPNYDAERTWLAVTKALATGVAWGIDGWARRLGKEPVEEQFEPFVWAYRNRAMTISGPEYLTAVEDMQRTSRDIAGFFTDYDMWLTPTIGQPPVPLGTFAFSEGDPFELRRRMATFSPYTYIANATGNPAMSVPLHWTEDGLPVGAHFLARYGDEATLIRLAAQLEEARPWAARRPPVSA
jgi:amidase